MEQEFSRTGILGIERLIEVKRSSGLAVLIPRIDVFLDAHLEAKLGSEHLPEKVNKAVDNAAKKSVTSLEEFGERIVRLLISCFGSAKIEIRMEAEYAVLRAAPVSAQKTQEMYKILSSATSENGAIKKMVGAEVTGMASCPCAQEGVADYVREKLLRYLSDDRAKALLKEIPIATHNQRNTARLLIEVPARYEIDAEELMSILEKSMSSGIYEVLKREDEARVVVASHMNPNFVEDIVRKTLAMVAKRFKELPEESVVIARSESFESIHHHNAIAERTCTLKELRKEFAA